jgi:hypothetical protein
VAIPPDHLLAAKRAKATEAIASELRVRIAG